MSTEDVASIAGPALVVAVAVVLARRSIRASEALLLQAVREAQADGIDADMAFLKLVAVLQSERRPVLRTVARVRVRALLRMRRRINHQMNDPDDRSEQ